MKSIGTKKKQTIKMKKSRGTLKKQTVKMKSRKGRNRRNARRIGNGHINDLK